MATKMQREPGDLEMVIECPMNVKIAAGEWALGDGTTYCVTAQGIDSRGEETYVVLMANVNADTAAKSAKAIADVLRSHRTNSGSGHQSQG